MRKTLKNSAFILCLLFASHPDAYPVEIRDYLDELRFVELQLSAVTTDMYQYLGWGADEKEAMKEASLRAISELDQLRGHVMRQDFPEETAPLKGLTLKMIGQLAAIYQGIEEKEEVAIKEEFAPFNSMYEEYAEGFKKLWQKSVSAAEAEQELNPLEEELRWIPDEQVKERYRKAAGHLEAKNHAAAYKVLKDMPEVIQDVEASHLVKLRLSDALLMMDYEAADIKGLDAAEQGLKLLAEIIASGRYSPVLYEAFYKWRTTEQELRHGMSNSSAIPNKEYNEKRWQVMRTIKEYSAKNPSDEWAQAQ